MWHPAKAECGFVSFGGSFFVDFGDSSDVGETCGWFGGEFV